MFSCTHKHTLTCAPTHTYMHRKDIWFDDVDLEMVDGEPVPKRPCIESTRVPLVTGSDKRYIHIVYMCDTLKGSIHLNIDVQESK